MRYLIAIWLGKIIYILTRFLKKGGGSAAPGYYALKIYPSLVSKLIKTIPSNIVITGTNGKTTTARILNHFIEKENVNVIRNATGSNLERGIVSSLINKSNLFGKITNIDFGIWELDEAAFNIVAPKIKPNIIIFLNAFRDQLDRYGEVDTVIKKWEKTLQHSDWNPVILINQGDNNTWKLKDLEKIKHYSFKVSNHTMFQEKTTFDTKQKFTNSDFQAEILKNNGLLGSEFKVTYPNGNFLTNFHIPGIYHVYDFLAAFAAFYLLNFPIKDIQETLNSFSPAFGRVEKFEINKKDGYIFLIKNPAGATQVFETIAPNIKNNDIILLALNDNFADGKDISWIWDAEFEKLLINDNETTKIICSGNRANELAVRLKYAGFNTNLISVENDLTKAFDYAKDKIENNLFILPTYTALLHLQKIMTDKGFKKHYWKN